MSDAGPQAPPPEGPSSNEEWTLTRTLALLGEQGRTGILEVTTSTTAARIHLRRGSVVYAEQTSGGQGWALGEFIVEGGALRSEALLDAKEEADRMGLGLEEYLIDRKLVSEDLVKRYGDLHVAEVLFPLFRQPRLGLRFLDERPKSPRLITALPVSYVIKEAARRAELWPGLRARVGGMRAIYTKDPGTLAELLGYVEPDGEDPIPEISAGARVVFFHVNGRKTVEQVARASGLGVFETYRALGELLDAYLVELVSHEGAGERPAHPAVALVRLVSVLTYLVLAALLALGADWSWHHAKTIRLSLTASAPQIRALVEETHVAELATALQLFKVERGTYPDRLEELRDAGYMGAGVAEELERLQYAPAEDGFALTRRVSP